MIIKKKVWPEYFEEITSGKKKFEFRLADFDIKEGDELMLEEYDPKTKKYTGRSITKKATFIRKLDLNSFGQKKEIEEKGFYIIQFE